MFSRLGMKSGEGNGTDGGTIRRISELNDGMAKGCGETEVNTSIPVVIVCLLMIVVVD